MKVVFLGATKGIGRALARLMAERGDHLFLLGRDIDDLRFSARDLELLGAGGGVGVAACDLLRPGTFGTALDQAAASLDGLDAVVVTAALFAAQEELEEDQDLRDRLLDANFANTIRFCEHARARLLAKGGGVLCVFSSVAGERARKPVIFYGATKAGLSYYLEGLDHKYRSRGLKTIVVKPGFVRTSMTAGLKPPPLAAEPEQVARVALKAIDKGRPAVYAPQVWRAVMLVIRNLPRWVMRRVEF